MEVLRRIAWPGLAVVALLGAPSAAQAETFNSADSGPITINDNTAATPYPSVINVEGGDGPIASVRVFMILTHNRPEDVDIALVSPRGSTTTLMTDSCGTGPLDRAQMRFDQAAANPLPDNTSCPLTGGTFRPGKGTGTGTTGWPAPGPSPDTPADLNRLVGTDPNGEWRLFVKDDDPDVSGSIAWWSLTISTNPAQVAIPAGPETSGAGGPYPSTKTFLAPEGQVITGLGLDVVLNHLNADDVDMVLQGPRGAAVMVMSDACGGTAVRERNWIFGDGNTPLSDSFGVDCMNFPAGPTDFEPGESLPAPAPQRPYEPNLAAFNGTEGGDYRLWVSDDTAGATGYITSWGIQTATRAAAATGFAAATATAAEGQSATLQVTRAARPDLGPATVDVAINHGGTAPADIGAGAPTQVQFARGEASSTLAIPIAADPQGEQAESFSVTLGNAADDALLSDATASSTVTIADNLLVLGKAKKKRNGTAKLPVEVPGPGQVTAVDAGPKGLIKPAGARASEAGTVNLKLKPTKRAKKKLNKGKKVKLTVAVSFEPTVGAARNGEAQVKLRKRR